MSVPSCLKCGHHFYRDSPSVRGLCQYCEEERLNPSFCCVCGKPATCSSISGQGYLCSNTDCHRADELAAERKFLAEYPQYDWP